MWERAHGWFCQDNGKAIMESISPSMGESVISERGGGLGIYRKEANGRITPLCLSPSMGTLSKMERTAYEKSQVEEGAFVLVHPSDKAFLLEVIDKTLSLKEPTTITFRIRSCDGAYLWVNGLFFKPSGGHIGEGVFGMIATPTSSLHELQMRVLDNSPMAVHIIDLESYELYYCNDAAFSLVGKKPVDYHGKRCHEVFFGIPSPCLFCTISQVRQGVVHNEFYVPMLGKYIRSDGEITSWDGRKVFVGYVHDNTRQHDQKKRLEDIFVHIPCGISVHAWRSGTLKTIVLGDQFRDLVGEEAYMRMKLSLDDFLLSVHVDDRERLRSALAEAALHEGNADISYRLYHSKKQWIKLRMRGNCTKNEKGATLFYSVTTDITGCEDQRRALAEVEATTRMKSEFMSRVSHDLRTPMNGILGTAYLAKDATDVQALQEGYRQIIMSGKYMLGLINDTLDIQKVEAGRMELHPEPCDEEAVFQGIIRMMEPTIREKGLDFRFLKRRIDWLWMNIDARRVQQIFVNLLSNAVKFTPRGGHVELLMECLSINDGLVIDRFTVRDDGIGMSDEFQRHMFEPFSQEHRVESEASGGSGLGLAIVRQLVNLMGGEIQVKSSIGKGSEFAFDLHFPIADKPDTHTVRMPELDKSVLVGKRVLLCEDHPLNADIATRILERVSIKVDLARDGNEGCELFARSSKGYYDAILMDIRMPFMTGLEAAKVIRASSHPDAKAIPIIAMSANAFDDDITASRDVGMDDYLVKPVEPEELYGKLMVAVGKGDS